MVTTQQVSHTNHLSFDHDEVKQSDRNTKHPGEHQLLHELVCEAQRLNDTLQIYNSWRCRMSVQLLGNYDIEELLEMHGTDSTKGKLTRHGQCYVLEKADETLRFILCEHATYTPSDLLLSHQCLRC